MRGDGLVADLAEERDLVGPLRFDQMVYHVQLTELEVGELLVADVTGEDGDGAALQRAGERASVPSTA